MNIVKQKVGNKTYVYLRESFWDPIRKKYSSRNVKNYGNLEDLLQQNPNFLEDLTKELEFLRNQRVTEKKLNVAQRAKEIKMALLRDVNSHGDNPCSMLGTYVLKRLWDKLSLTRKIRDMQQQTHYSSELALACFFMTAARLLMPDSKLSQWQHRNQIFSKAKDLSLQTLYRSLDFLHGHKEELIQYLNRQIAKHYQRTVNVALYDVTTYYFESQEADTLRSFGFSKDNKVNQVQVVMGLLIDDQGIPIDYELFAGNQNEFATMIPILKKLKSLYKIDKVIVTADRGLNSAANLLAIKELGMNYVIAYRLRNAGSCIKALITEQQGWHNDQHVHSEIKKYKIATETRTVRREVDGETQTVSLTSNLLINYSEKRARKDCHDRQRLIEKAQRLVDTPSLLRSELKRGGKSYLSLSENQLSAELDQDKITNAEFWDGYYGIVYSDKDMPVEQVLKIHHSLWQIEESFRISKSLLVARPCFHWTEKRIRGHFLVCYLALVMHRLLEAELTKQGVILTADSIVQALREAAVAEVKLSDQDTVYCKMNTQGAFEQISQAMGLGQIARISSAVELKAALKVKSL